MVTTILFGLFALFLLLGAPIATCLGMSSVAAMIALGAGRSLDVVLGTVPQLVSAAITKSVLMAIPFFILGGNIMEKSGISSRLINLAQSCVGHFKGGVAMVCVLVACFFAAISGSGPATVAALGLILIPAMIEVGYKPAFAAALMATAGAIGVIIPPSITFVVYGSISDVSIGDLFISGVIPGLLMGAALILITLWLGRKAELKLLPRASWKEHWAAFKEAFWGLLMPVIILGGIYGGIFTPTEAAAVSAVYGLFVGLFVYRSLSLRDMKKILIDSASTTAVVMLITAAASLFAYVLTRARIDVAISSALETFAGGNTVIFLIIVNICLLIAGCFLDSTSALYIFTPLFLPVAQALGMNLVHFGTIMIVNLAIGLVTPPVGVNLYVACGIAKIDLKTISKAVVPLIIASLVVLLLVTYVPQLSLALLGGA